MKRGQSQHTGKEQGPAQKRNEIGVHVPAAKSCILSSIRYCSDGSLRLNYIELFRDSVFLRALKNTIIIVVVSVPITCIFSLWISSAIYQMPGKLLSFFRIVFYLPVITGSVAVTVVWKWMFNNYYGIFNYLGTQTGLISQRINWLGDERYALGCIILILLTTSVGQPIVLYVSMAEYHADYAVYSDHYHD